MVLVLLACLPMSYSGTSVTCATQTMETTHIADNKMETNMNQCSVQTTFHTGTALEFVISILQLCWFSLS